MLDDTSGRIRAAKTATTPRDFVAGMLEALASTMQTYGTASGEVGLLYDPTTIVTNALLEDKVLESASWRPVAFAMSRNCGAPRAAISTIPSRTRRPR